MPVAMRAVFVVVARGVRVDLDGLQHIYFLGIVTAAASTDAIVTAFQHVALPYYFACASCS